MDPLTQALTALNTILRIAEKIYDATPAPLREQGAADWAKFVHNSTEVVLALQDEIKKAVTHG